MGPSAAACGGQSTLRSFHTHTHKHRVIGFPAPTAYFMSNATIALMYTYDLYVCVCVLVHAYAHVNATNRCMLEVIGRRNARPKTFAPRWAYCIMHGCRVFLYMFGGSVAHCCTRSLQEAEPKHSGLTTTTDPYIGLEGECFALRVI